MRIHALHRIRCRYPSDRGVERDGFWQDNSSPPCRVVPLSRPEASWPDLPGSPYAGEVRAVEAELTPKPLARTTAIMAGLLARTSDYQPGARPGPGRATTA
jgi:hypothetical protein